MNSELFDENILAAKETEREHNRVQLALEGSLQFLHDRKREIEEIFDTRKPKIAFYESQIILCSEIEEAVKSRMIVPEYSQRGSAKQQIYVFVGTHWEMALIQIYYDFVKDACRRIGLSEVYVQDPVYMNKVFENVAFRVSHHIHTAQPHEGVWINLKNGTVEINPNSLQASADGESQIIVFREHRAEDFFQYCLPYNYDPEATCPLWHKFLDEVLPEEDSQSLLGEYIGYSFTQNLKLEKMAVFYGNGANGKSVCLEIIKRLMGRVNVSEVTLSSATTEPEARALMQNKLLNISSESGKKLEPAVLKMLISGEPVEMRILYVGTKLLLNPPKLITSYNELPPIENTHGYRRRWMLFPFNKTIPDCQQDPSLANKLALELSGILNWVIEHLTILITKVNSHTGEDFTKSMACQAALDEYFKAANSGLMFAEECCVLTKTCSVKLKDVYESYQTYCRVSGFSKPMLKKNFKKNMIDWGAKMESFNGVVFMNVKVKVEE